MPKASNKNTYKKVRGTKNVGSSTYIIYDDETYTVQNTNRVRNTQKNNISNKHYSVEDFAEYTDVLGDAYDMQQIVDAVNCLVKNNGRVSALHVVINLFNTPDHITFDTKKMEKEGFGVYMYCKYLLMSPEEKAYMQTIIYQINTIKNRFIHPNSRQNLNQILRDIYNLYEDDKTSDLIDYCDSIGTYRPLDIGGLQNAKDALESEREVSAGMFIEVIRTYLRIRFVARMVYFFSDFTQYQPTANKKGERDFLARAEHSFDMFAKLSETIDMYKSWQMFTSQENTKLMAILSTITSTVTEPQRINMYYNVLMGAIMPRTYTTDSVFEYDHNMLIYFLRAIGYDTERDGYNIIRDMRRYYLSSDRIAKMYDTYLKGDVNQSLQFVKDIMAHLHKKNLQGSELGQYLTNILRTYYIDV